LLLNFPSRSRASRSGFYPAAAAVKKVAVKPQSQPPGKNSTAETPNLCFYYLAKIPSPTGCLYSQQQVLRLEKGPLN